MNTLRNLSTQQFFGLHLLIYGLLFLLLGTVLSSCSDNCTVEQQYTYYEPVYTSLSELRSAVDIEPPRDINATGKLFFKDNYLFINEPNKGIHVINNHDPSNPEKEAFINVPGSFDLVVKGNLLYTDSYIDLVVIDISNLDQVQEVGRVENVFNSYNSYGYYVDTELGVVSDWKEVEKVEMYESECDAQMTAWGGMHYEDGIAMPAVRAFSSTAAVAPTNPGMGGSMARFALASGHLYTLDLNDLLAFDISTPASPLAGERQFVDGGIETIFPVNDKLFLGGQRGMVIMDLTNPLSPEKLSTYQHVRSCDPVVVDGDYAYVTLRSGTQCQGFTNQLEVIDITDVLNPELLHVYQMTNPHGLGKDGDALFICDGEDGLKVYNANDISTIGQNQLAHYQNIKAFDIIPFNKVAMMIAEDGLYQYDYSDLSDIKFLSHIEIISDEL